MKMNAQVRVMLKRGVLDPQGAAVANALGTLGFDGVDSVRQGKVFEIALEAADEAAARETLDAMCRKLLSNAVIEDYEITLNA